MNYSYTFIFVLFGICAIWPISSRGTKKSKLFYSFILYFANAQALLINVFYIMFCILRNRSLNVPFALKLAEFIENSVVFVIRLSFFRKIRDFKKIVKIVKRFGVKEDRKICVTMLVGFSVIMHTIKFVTMVELAEIDAPKVLPGRFITAMKTSGTFEIISMYIAFNMAFFIEMPYNAFVLFFLIVSLDLKNEMKHFLKLMRSGSVDWKNLLRSYNFLKIIIIFIDDKVSFFVLCEIFLSWLIMFFIVTLVLRFESFENTTTFLLKLYSVLLTVNIVTTFFIITTCACSVSEAYAKIWIKLRSNILLSDIHFVRNYHFDCVDKEVSFTLWKIVPINRPFVFRSFGLILTYVMLFDDILYLGKK